jgi:diguanylate cyclase (GGDEF)-like protein
MAELTNKPDRFEQDIKACFEKGFKRLSFQDTIEKRYDDHDRPRRKRRYLTLGLPALLFYDLFCFADKIVLPDIYQLTWTIRLAIVTPILAATLMAIRLKRFERQIDHLAGLMLLLTSASICLMLLVSNHPNLMHYYTGIIIIVTFGNIVLRQPFRYATAFSLAIFLIYAVSARFITLMPIEAVNNSTLVIFTSVVISLIGNYQMEYEQRRDFLLTTLQRINAVKLEAANLELEKLSISDPLTGLFNRRHFNATLEREWYAAARNRYPLALIYLDIDYFKPYNDNYGHGAGDRCLQKIGEALKDNVRRAQDLFARYGGEEFVVLLPRASQDQAHDMAENIRQTIEKMTIPHAHSNVADHITVSLGVAGMVPNAELKPDHLLDLADRALYTAKEAGRNQTHITENGSSS